MIGSVPTTKRRWVVPAAIVLIVGMAAASAIASTSWSPGPKHRTINDPKACTNVPYSGTCVTGGMFADGPPSFATAVDGSTHYWYAAWTSDRPPANEQSPMIPYGDVCAIIGNPNNVATVTAASYTTNTWSLSAYSESDVTRNLLGGPGTGGPVSIREVGTTATTTLNSAFSAPNALDAGDTVTIEGTDQVAYNGTFTVTSVPSTTRFTFTTPTSNNPDATGGTSTIHAATFDTSVANSLDANSLVKLSGTSPAAYDGTWNVSSVASSTEFVANIGAAAAPGTTGTLDEYAATFTTAATGLAVGRTVTVSNFSGSSAGYDGTWMVRQTVAGGFKADLKTAPASSPATGTGYATVPPYCSGVFFTRSSDGGTTWSPAVSLSDPFTHADRYSIAVSGNYVYAVWTPTVGYYSSMCNDSPRVMYFDVSSDYGATWSEPTATRLSPISDRVDYPSMGAGPLGSGSSGDVYVVDTETPDGANPIGDTAPVYLYLSHDRGGTWSKTQVGSTTATLDSRYGSGLPSCPGVTWDPPSVEGNSGVGAVAGDGTNIGVAWVTDDLGHAVARISTDDGTGWSTQQDLTLSGAKGTVGRLYVGSCPSGGASNGYGACGASLMSVASDWSNHRLGFAWIDDTCLTVSGWYLTCGGGNSSALAGVYARVWTASGGWGSGTLISCFTTSGACSGSPDRTLKKLWDGYSPSIAFFGTTGVGVAWTACRRGKHEAQPCDGSSKDPGPEIAYKESGDGGASWAGDWPGSLTARIVANDENDAFGGLGASRVNEWPTLVYDKPGSSYAGCAQQGGGAAEVGCQKIVYFLGRNTPYTIYRMYLEVGTVS